MHLKKEDLPVAMEGPGTKFRFRGGFGGMVIAYWEMPAGPENKTMFEGLPDNACHCPHWGYLLKGKMTLHYTDGTEETAKAGEVYYAPAGHTGRIDEDVAVLEFSPEKEYMEVMAHIGKNMQAAG